MKQLRFARYEALDSRLVLWKNERMRETNVYNQPKRMINYETKGALLMQKSNNKLVDLSVSFAVEILNLVKYLKSLHETIICNQIGRAGTSIGANIRETQYAQGKADFISKLQIALKEANGTSCWLLLLVKTSIISMV